jgi:branched-chain amino acid transport system substrate-binding protein
VSTPSARLSAAAAAAVVALAFAATAASRPAAHSAASASTISVGGAYALTGVLTASDTSALKGAQLAVDTINAAGGVNGHKFAFHPIDMASTASTGVSVVNQLMNQYQASVILAGSSSASTAAYESIVQARKVPVIAWSVLPTSPDWEFSILPYVGNSIQAQLQFAATHLKAKRVAFLYGQNPYGQQGSAIISKLATRYDITVASNLGVDATATDLTPLLARVRDANVDAVLSLLSGPLQIVLAKNEASLGLNLPTVHGQDAPSVMQSASAAYGPTYFLTIIPAAYPNIPAGPRKVAFEAFLKAYNKKYGDFNTDDINAVAGWDEVWLLAKAVKKSGATGGDALRAALEGLQFTGTQTDYHYTPDDHTGQLRVVNPFAVGQWHGSNLTIVAPFAVSISAKVGAKLVLKTTGKGIVFQTAGGGPVVALRPGQYTILVRDLSSKLNLHLAGAGVNKRTSVPGKTQQAWSVKLGAGTLTYKSDAGGVAGGSVTIG